MTRLLLLFVLLLIATPAQAELPKLLKEKSFDCATLAEAVNYYIALGEAAGAKELAAHTISWDDEKQREGGFSRNERVGWICRIVYEPKGKGPLRQPYYGSPRLPRLSMPLERWPLVPVASSGQSYFVLLEGNGFLGSREEPHRYLKYCQTEGKFRSKPIPVPTKVEAQADVQELRRSEAWKAIKWSDRGEGFSYKLDESPVWEFIQQQAELTPK